MMTPWLQAARLVGAETEMTSVFQLVDWIEAGIPQEAVSCLANQLPFPARELLTQAVGVDPRARKWLRPTLRPSEGDALIRGAYAFCRSLDVFGSEELAGKFMARENIALRDQRPLLLSLQSSVGLSLVVGVLGRVEVGTAP